MKKIIKTFNNIIKTSIFKVQNKTNSNFKISALSKYLIILIASLFIYLFYLLIPLLYDKTWVQTNIESKLLNEFKLNLSSSGDISYRILPSPHFLIKDSKILAGHGKKIKSIAEIKNFQIFLSQGNFFNKEKMNIKIVVISDANFTLLRSDLKLLNDFTSKKFSNKKIKINNSNLFFKDNLKDIISIIKINKTVSFFDNKKLSNFLNLKGEIFNLPFIFEFNNHNDSIKYQKINFSSKPLKLNISNKSIIKKKIIYGKSNISFLSSSINTKYNFQDKLISFKSDNTKLDNSEISFTGELSINPFDLNFNINLDDHNIFKLLNINPILIEFIKSGLLFNDNISVNIFINIFSNEEKEIFQNAKINFNIIDGKINLNKTKFVNDDIGSLQLSRSNLFIKNNDLVLNSDILIDIKNSKNLFSLLNTPKSSRKDLKSILINFDYNFLNNKIKFNIIKIYNSNISNQLLTIIDSFNDNNINNFIRSRRLLNKLLKVYAG